VCRTSILLVRGQDGNIRAFHSMCSHRGNSVVWDAKGSCKAFACKFNSWTYGLDGALRNVPDEKNFFGLKKKALGLTPVAVDTWEGVVFVNVDPHPSETLCEYLGEFGPVSLGIRSLS
jgi:Rieske 2Fe-2S family protein